MFCCLPLFFKDLSRIFMLLLSFVHSAHARNLFSLHVLLEVYSALIGVLTRSGAYLRWVTAGVSSHGWGRIGYACIKA